MVPLMVSIPPSYIVNQDGDIWSVATGKLRKMKTADKDGYKRVQLILEDGIKRLYVHRIVCEAFHGPPPTIKSVCRHLDGNKNNNHYTNLAWGTQKDNVHDAIAHGTHIRGERVHTSKLVEQDIIAIRQSPLSKKTIAEIYGVCLRTIQQICSRGRWKHVE